MALCYISINGQYLEKKIIKRDIKHPYQSFVIYHVLTPDITSKIYGFVLDFYQQTVLREVNH